MNKEIDKILNFGVIGCGAIAQTVHIPLLFQNPFINIGAICDSRINLVKKIAKKYNIRNYYSNYDRLIAENHFDAIIICTNSDSHVPIAIDVMKKGINVLIEKPAAMTKDDALALKKTSKSHKVFYSAGYMWRYDAGVTIAQNIFIEKRHGKTIYFEAGGEEGGNGWAAGALSDIIHSEEKLELSPSRRPDYCNDSDLNWAFEILVDTGIHIINLIRSFIGMPRSILCSNIYEFKHHTEQTRNIRIMSIFNYNDFNLYFNCSWVPLDYIEKGLKIYGDRGNINVKLAPPLHQKTAASVEYFDVISNVRHFYHAPWIWSYQKQLESFIKNLSNKNKRNDIGRFDDIFEDIQIIDAIMRSFIEKKEISFKK